MIDVQTLRTYQPPAELLKGRVIVVTGAGAGIGRVASLTFAEYGATVVLIGRTMAKLEAVYDEIESRGWPKPAIVPMNFEGAAEQDFVEVANVLASEFGRVDGLLHNASELGPRTPLNNYPLAEWQKIFQVNVTAPFVLTRVLLPLMTHEADASILFTGSGVGIKGRAYWGAYAASKAAVDNLMETLADETDGTNIRVNSLNPGATRTRMRAQAYPAEDPGTVTPPEALMNQYLYLIGPDSAPLNGAQINAQ